jgi:hypothetical protein
MEREKAIQMNIDDFTYTIRYNPHLRDKEANGSKACSYIAEDVISKVMYNNRKGDALFCRPRYFSHAVFMKVGSYCWTISIDFDLLNFDKFEIVVNDFGYPDIRVHVKDEKWFDTINELRNIDLIREAVIMYKTAEILIKKLRYTYANIIKSYSSILPEKYASDFVKE